MCLCQGVVTTALALIGTIKYYLCFIVNAKFFLFSLYLCFLCLNLMLVVPVSADGDDSLYLLLVHHFGGSSDNIMGIWPQLRQLFNLMSLREHKDTSKGVKQTSWNLSLWHMGGSWMRDWLKQESLMSPWLFCIYLDGCVREMKAWVGDLNARLRLNGVK